MSKKISLVTMMVLGLLLLPACSLAGLPILGREQVVTIAGIYEDIAELEGQEVAIEGYGVIQAMMPLCEGHKGIDTRAIFVDKAQGNITVRGWPSEAVGQQLRTFTAVVHVFRGEVGCPGEAAYQEIPYLELTGIK